MSAAFTPGPWYVDGEAPADSPPAIIIATQDLVIAEVFADERSDEPETVATADLIAAAPELYASLIELLEPLERASAELVAHGKVADENAEAAFDRARAALAKARGGR